MAMYSTRLRARAQVIGSRTSLDLQQKLVGVRVDAHQTAAQLLISQSTLREPWQEG